MSVWSKFGVMLKEKLASITPDEPVFDAAQFNDPLALEVNWEPAQSGGSNFCSHRIKTYGSHRVCFKTSAMGLIFPCIFIVLGAVVSIAFVASGINQGELMPVVMALLIGVVFIGVGSYLLWRWTRLRVFDRNLGYYWKGADTLKPHQLNDKIEYCRLFDIYAIQLVSERCTSSSSDGRSSSYYSYELNLVLSDKRRITVIDHGSLQYIRADAAELQRFLQVPLWDAT